MKVIASVTNVYTILWVLHFGYETLNFFVVEFGGVSEAIKRVAVLKIVVMR